MITIDKDGKRMIRKVKAYMKKNNMLKIGDRIVVGVSGGADSICLLYVLKKLSIEYRLTLYVVHINHGIRENEADRDEQFVKEYCSRLGTQFYYYHVDVREIAEKDGLSEEEAGRKVRYQAFLDICKERNCEKIAIAHNKNDNAETVLFHLFRGSGIKGLSGIDPTRIHSQEVGDVELIRPLLCVTREEIEEYLSQEEITYMIDSTNLADDYTRNKIRNRILNYATKEINPQAVGNITEAAMALKEIDDYLNININLRYEALVHYDNRCYRFSIRSFLAEPIVIQRGIVLLVLEKLAGARKDLEAKHVRSVLTLADKQVGKQVHLPYGIIAEKGYNDIKVYPRQWLQDMTSSYVQMEPIRVAIPGRTDILQERKFLETRLENYKKTEPIPKSSCVKWFDYDKIENAVEIRTRKEGDYIQIDGFGGRKKLKDYFIDHKIPQKQRDNQILITDGSHVMWIPGAGERMSEKYKVEDTTIKILLMKLIDLEVEDES